MQKKHISNSNTIQQTK